MRKRDCRGTPKARPGLSIAPDKRLCSHPTGEPSSLPRQGGVVPVARPLLKRCVNTWERKAPDKLTS